MKTQKMFTRNLIAAAILVGASAAHAISVGASVGATVDGVTQTVAETGITTGVKAKLATDARVKGSDISVTTDHGVVVLTGTALSAEAKAAAADIAQASAGADVKVINRIEAPSFATVVKSEAKLGVDATQEVITDAWISTKLKTQLLADATTKGTSIRVNTKDNVVFLKGTVASQAEKDQAVKLASETKGVARVNARKLRVAASAKASVN